jgi:hypothetical protein
MTAWERQDARGKKLEVGDLCVGDSGRVYRVLPDQYATGGDFLRVCYVSSRRGRWVYNEEDVRGQHGGCVVRVTAEELEAFAYMDKRLQKQGLARLFYERYSSQRRVFQARQTAKKGRPRRLVEVDHGDA